MQVLKEDSPAALKIRRIESLLAAEEVEISFRCDGMLISFGGNTFVIRDGGSGDLSQSIPSFAEPTRIQTIDDYIHGR